MATANLPTPLRSLARRLYENVAIYRTGGEPLVPPARLHTVGDTDFRATGDEFLGLFRDLADLQPSERVLDVGCGIGRLARPLAGYLSASGSYDGFDVADVAIRWCSHHYSRSYPNFNFRHVNVANGNYNPAGAVPAEQFSFPYDDASFDFLYATSVFTHMLPAAVERYVSEISRVLAPGGRSLTTFFLLNDESRELIAKGQSTQPFKEARQPYAVVDERIPEVAVAYDEGWVIDLYERVGTPARRPPSYGRWCGRSAYTRYQDILIADKPAPPAS